MVVFPELADHMLIWIFGIILPFISGLQSQQLSGAIQFNEYTRKKLYLSNSLMLALAGSVILVLWFFKQRSFDSLGFRLPQLDNQYLIVSTLIVVFIIGYVLDLYFSTKKMNSLKQSETWFEKSSFLPEKTKELPS